MGLRFTQAQEFDHVYLVGLHDARPPEGEGAEDAGEAIIKAARSARDRLVLAYPACTADGKARVPVPLVEDARRALGAEWEDRQACAPEPADSLRAAVQAMRQELLDGVVRLGGRLGELRLDTDLDISLGVVRYLELVKLVALLERPEGQGLTDALDDVNARLLAAATPLQREILESSTLDEMLLSGEREVGASSTAELLGSIAREERSLESFLPRRGAGLLLSASDVETYRSCPLRYKYRRVLRIPSEPTFNQRFGIVVHQVLERYHVSGTQTLAELMELLDVCWRRSGLGDGEQQRTLLEKARASLALYHEQLHAQAGEPVWFERSFAFELGPHRLRGRVDRVDRLQDGSYELIDYKTGRPKSESQLQGDIQLSLYGLAARESWQLEASSLAYYYVLDAKKVPVPPRSADLEWVQQAVLEAGEGILAERFDPTPSDAACSVCDYRIVCPAAEG
jgi:DNA helicase-2/ATP-dependent DNA helicase PcrA